MCLCLLMTLLPAPALGQSLYTLTLRGGDHISLFTAETDTLDATSGESLDLAAGTEVRLSCYVYKDSYFIGWDVLPAAALTIPDSSAISFIMPAKNISIKPNVIPINAQISDGILTWNAIRDYKSKVAIYIDQGFVTSFNGIR